jgi:hypothetical protein
MIENLIWSQFYRVSVRSAYLEKLLKQNETIDRRINIFFAITSSSSIAGWAIWKDLAFIWGFVIAASQLLNAVLPLFPYKERIKSLSGLARDLRQLAITLESKWIDISAGDITEKEMRKIYHAYLRQEAEFEEKYFHGKSIPEDIKLFNDAENEVLLSLSIHINNGGSNGT